MNAPVITITLNPAIDLTVTVDTLTPGAEQRASAARSDVGGKGINVAGCLADWGTPVIATGVMGRANHSLFNDFFTAKRIQDRFIHAPGETRTNIKIVSSSGGDTTNINLPGMSVTPAVLERVLLTLDDVARPDELIVLAGSLPIGLPNTTWASITATLSRLKARVVLDTSGAPLAASLAEGVPFLPMAIKPNRAEMESWVGHSLPALSDLIAPARTLTRRGIKLVVVSLGEDGALFVTPSQAVLGQLPPLKAVNTVGAGDAMVAGMVAGLADNLDLDSLARRAVAFATGKLARIGPHLPSPAEIEAMARAVTITPVAD